MKYLKLYQNESDYLTEIGENAEALLPNVSLLEGGGREIKFNPKPVREAYFWANSLRDSILSTATKHVQSLFSEMYLNDNKENLIKHYEIIEGSFTILPDTDLEYVEEGSYSPYWKNTSKKSITTSSIESYIIECDEPLLDNYKIGISFAGARPGSTGFYPPYFIATGSTLYSFFNVYGLDINDYRIDENTIDITSVLNKELGSLAKFYVVIFKVDSDNNAYPIDTHNHYKVVENPEETFDVLNTRFVGVRVLDFKLECNVEIQPATDVLFYYEDGEYYEFMTVESAITEYGYNYGFDLSADRKSIVPNENFLQFYGPFSLYGIMRNGEILSHECKILYTNDNFYIYPNKLGENKIRFVLKDRFAGIDCFSNNSDLTRLNKNALRYNKNVPQNAYEHCGILTNINIPGSVTSIGNSAFFYCQSLKNINIPNSVTSIGNSAFTFCYSLTNINIPNSITFIGDSAFYSCTGLTSINIPNSVTSIGDGAFSYCSGLTDVNISNGSIGNSAFEGCNNLTDVNISSGVTSIGSRAFFYCGSLKNINIPNSVTSIGYQAFYRCSGLTSINIPSGSIGSEAFRDCRNLTDVNISSGVTSIGDGAFRSCGKLTNINIPNSVTKIGRYAFANCSGLTSIIIPNGVTSIEYGIFSGCTSLTNIDIPDSVTSIREKAFYNCTNLISINIPSGVTYIESRAFLYCSSLNNITCSATNAPTLYTYCFNGISANGVLRVPTGSDYSTWQSALPSDWTIEYI